MKRKSSRKSANKYSRKLINSYWFIKEVPYLVLPKDCPKEAVFGLHAPPPSKYIILENIIGLRHPFTVIY